MSNPVFMPWKDEYLAGHPVIDKQHKILVDKLNKVMASLEYGEGDKPVEEITRDCVQYVKINFATEDKIMRESGFPDEENHRKIHFQLIADINNFYMDMKNGKIPDPTIVGDFLQNWLLKHIKENDRKLASHAKDNPNVTVNEQNCAV